MSIDPSAMIHPGAIVEDGAVIGPECRIGPFCHVGPDVRLGARVILKSHVSITGLSEIGNDTEIYPFVSIGSAPQDLSYKGEATRIVIGQRNQIREHVTMSVGTARGSGVTEVGDDGFFMMGCHVAHDCKVGNRVIMTNSSALGGHCIIEDDVILGGLSGVHQRVRVGRGAIIGGLGKAVRDVMPYALVEGANSTLHGLNLVGLKRRGASRDDIMALRAAFQALAQGEGTFLDRARRLTEDEAGRSPYVQHIVDFILADSDRSFITPG